MLWLQEVCKRLNRRVCGVTVYIFDIAYLEQIYNVAGSRCCSHAPEVYRWYVQGTGERNDSKGLLLFSHPAVYCNMSNHHPLSCLETSKCSSSSNIQSPYTPLVLVALSCRLLFSRQDSRFQLTDQLVRLLRERKGEDRVR